MLGYLFVTVSFLKLRKSHPELERPYRVPKAKLVGTLALLATVFFICLYLPGSPSALIWPQEWLIVLVWALLGVTFYFIARGRVSEMGREVNNHRLEGGGFKGCQLEIDCRREEARHPGSLCTPLPSRPLCFLNSPPDILGPRSAGPKTSSSGEQTPEGVLGSLFLLATARSYSGPGVVGRIRTRGRGRVQPYPRLCAAHVPSRSDESDRAHEPLLDRSKPFYDISVSKRCALLGPFSCALRACSDARDHNTTIFSSPKGEGFRPSPEETLKRKAILGDYAGKL